jgi:uncharacterized membrane protein (Fun14 family)
LEKNIYQNVPESRIKQGHNQLRYPAVMVGLFIAGLAYLSYKGWIDVKCVAIENSIRSTLTNVAVQAVHVLNNTASQFAAHSITIEAAGIPVAAAFGFMPGLKRG